MQPAFCLIVILSLLLAGGQATRPVGGQSPVLVSPLQQTDEYAGVWQYGIRDTPYGDFSGKILLSRDNSSYKASIINDRGVRYRARVLRFKGNRIVLWTDMEDTDALLSGYFEGDSLVGQLEVKGDAFVYKIIAKKTYETK